MITQLQFQNFKALKNAELKLGAFNVIVGPNGSGKSSVLQGLELLAEPQKIDYQKVISAGAKPNVIRITTGFDNYPNFQAGGIDIEINNKRTFLMGSVKDTSFIPESVFWDIERRMRVGLNLEIARQAAFAQFQHDSNQSGANPSDALNPKSKLKLIYQHIKVFSFESGALGQPVNPQSITELNREGRNLAGALTHLRDKDDDAFNQLLDEFRRWIPEYSSIGFENDQNGYRSLTLKQKASRHTIQASQASEGTLLALALLTIVHQPTSPTLVGLEEPDRGLHPRLLRELRDALYRLSFPSDFGIKRTPVQVVVTTHSPFFLDLFKDHPEQVIIAEKSTDGTSTFKNLSDDKELRELIGDAPLGEVWYSGVLGGVPVAA
jgi:predicted ATPase